jgi:hypothetical protein
MTFVHIANENTAPGAGDQIMSDETTSFLVYETTRPIQEIALNNAPDVEDENGSGPFSPQTLHLSWHLSADETSWDWGSVTIEGPLHEKVELSIGTVTRGTRRYVTVLPQWLQSVVDSHRPS